MNPCPCGSGHPYPNCCGRWHRGDPAPSAEALMRSRYCAFVLELGDYLLASWHPDTRPAEIAFEEPKPQWRRLQVLSHQSAGDHASVHFVATYKLAGRAYKLEEHSRFVRQDGRWFYLDAAAGEV